MPQSLLDTGRDPVQSVEALIDLRNALVHFHPEALDIDTEHRLEKRLRGRFEPNKQPVGAPWYLNSALAAGCAQWACKVAMEFADQWREQLGLTNDFREELASFGKP